MKYLVDTCVISELIKPQPSQRVVACLKSLENDRLFLSVITIGELEKGIAKLSESRRKRQLIVWLDQHLIDQFEERLIPFDQECARRWGQIQGLGLARGETLPVIDAMIAATAMTRNLTVITRNTADMDRCGAATLNPWVFDE